jgi:asparagine synthetase B (glutamine-hydrolysing)
MNAEPLGLAADRGVHLPHLTISWRLGNAGGIHAAEDVFPAGEGVAIGCRGFRPKPVVKDDGRVCVAVIGAPIRNDRVDAEGVADAWLRAGDINAFLRGLDGQFLLLRLDRDRRRLIVANDRFTSIPLYWAEAGGHFIASTLYFDLFSHLRRQPGFALRKEALFEFLWLQKLLHDKTYDRFSRFLMPATVLAVGGERTEEQRYWRPDFTKVEARSEREAGAEFTALLRASVKRRTSDRQARRYGHFLSGGHDSRTVLAAFDEPPTCFTVSFSDNYEVACARRAAAAAHAPHRFLKLPADHFLRHLDDLGRLTGGMYAIDHGLFVGLEQDVQAHADVVFHGHGFDYLFQGMYLPARWMNLFGRPTFFRKLTPLHGDIAEKFLHDIPFRLKNVDLASLVLPERRAGLMDSLRAAAQAVIADGEDVCRTDYDRWEYLVVHALARHYSYPNISSKLTCAEQRTVSFDNDLFDFYCGLPARHRLSGQMLRHALKRLNPKLARIPTGNWGIAAGASPAYKTAFLVGRKLLRHATGIQAFRAPTLADRTWPDRSHYLREHPNLFAKVREAVGSEELRDALDFLDWTKIEERIEDFAADSAAAGLLMSLLSLHRLLVLSR